MLTTLSKLRTAVPALSRALATAGHDKGLTPGKGPGTSDSGGFRKEEYEGGTTDRGEGNIAHEQKIVQQVPRDKTSTRVEGSKPGSGSGGGAGPGGAQATGGHGAQSQPEGAAQPRGPNTVGPGESQELARKRVKDETSIPSEGPEAEAAAKASAEEKEESSRDPSHMSPGRGYS